MYQVPIVAGWRGSVEYEVCLTLLHITSTGNRTPDLDFLILSPTPYPLDHVLPLLIAVLTGSANKQHSQARVVDCLLLFGQVAQKNSTHKHMLLIVNCCFDR